MSSAFNDSILAAVLFLQSRYPFWSYLLHKCTYSPAPDVATACVNRLGHIRFNAQWLLNLPVECRAFVLAHEVAHVAFGVFWRGKDHNPELSNQAHDYVVNWILHEDYVRSELGLTTVDSSTLMTIEDLRGAQSNGRSTIKSDRKNLSWAIPGCLIDEDFAGMSYEEVYSLLSQQPKDEQSSLGMDVDRANPTTPSGEAPQTTEEEAAHDDLHWRGAVLEAAVFARNMGKLPAHLERAIGKVSQPRVDWRARLAIAARQGNARQRLNYNSVSRRQSQSDFLLPREVEKGFDVALAVDTSGSVSAAELDIASSEAAAILRGAGGRLKFFACDAAVGSFRMVRHPRDFQLVGGGGTDFKPVFEALASTPPKLLIYFTDLGGSFPEQAPPYRVIWAVYAHAASAKPPFGEVVVIPDR